MWDIFKSRTTYLWLAFTLCMLELLVGVVVPWNMLLLTAAGEQNALQNVKPLLTLNRTNSTLVGNLTSIRSNSTNEADPHPLRTQRAPSLPPLMSRPGHENGTGNPSHTSPVNGTSLDLDGIIANLSMPWNFNATRKALMRKLLDSAIPAADFAILTRKNVAVGQNITFALNARFSHPLKTDMFNFLPKDSLLSNLSSCTVVGNSGILAKSQCGQAIDKNDFVFRCNTPPIKSNGQHAGFKTSLTSINPAGVIGVKYKNLGSASYRNKFVRDMKVFGSLLVPAYGPNIYSYKTSLVALKLLRQRGSPTNALIINPDHFRAVQKSWEKLGLQGRMTTGFYLASVALAACDSVELYGYWPFDEGAQHKPVSYHYYDNMKKSKGIHNFNWEFDVLYKLHMGGALHMHVGPCV